MLCLTPHGALSPACPGVPAVLVSGVCVTLQVYNSHTSKSSDCLMIYLLHKALKFLGLDMASGELTPDPIRCSVNAKR